MIVFLKDIPEYSALVDSISAPIAST